MAANYDTKEPWQLENGQWFNYGAPGSLTEQINQQNPTAALDKPYVQEGDTGGYLAGKGVTLGPGTSITEAEKQSYLSQASNAGIDSNWVSNFLQKNPGDYNRITEAYNSGGGGGDGSPSSQWLAYGQSGSSAGNDFYNQLLQRSQQSLNINRNDPIIRAQSDAFAAQQERSRRGYLNDQAEKLGPLANLQGEARLTAERAGQQTGAFEAQLMGRELQARRDEIAQALALMSGRLSTTETLALQRELGLIDAQLRQQALSQGNDQFLRDLALRTWVAGDTSALNWAYGG